MDTSNKNDKAKTVATIEINMPTVPRVDKKQWLDESVTDHCNCVLCGTPMRFKHKADFIAGIVVEDAHCPACGIRNRQSTYTLQ